MKCPGCGREVGDGARFCEWCGTNLVLPAVEGSPIVMQGKKPLPSPVYLIIIGIIVIVAGGIVYAVAWSQTMNDLWEDPMYPDSNPFDGLFDLMMLSYIVMAIGTVLVFVGMILLVMNE